jgi:hypothetical protein
VCAFSRRKFRCSAASSRGRAVIAHHPRLWAGTGRLVQLIQLEEKRHIAERLLILMQRLFIFTQPRVCTPKHKTVAPLSTRCRSHDRINTHLPNYHSPLTRLHHWFEFWHSNRPLVVQRWVFLRRAFSIVRFIHSRLVLWNKHHQAHPVAERKSRIHSNGPIQRTNTHSPSCT